MEKQKDIKKVLIETTALLLDEAYVVEEITIRKIADEAHVAVGLINYHFKSKEDLLLASIDHLIGYKSKIEMRMQMNKSTDSKQVLRSFLFGVADIVKEYKKYSLIILKYEVLSGGFDTPLVIVGLIKKIMPHLSERQARHMALQVVAPLQIAFLKEEALKVYLDNEKLDYHQLIEETLSNLGL